MRLITIGTVLLLAGCDTNIHQAEEMVRRTQRDPDATQFRNVKACPTGFYVTGEVNGKNAYGAYVGFQTFYANSAGSHTVGEDEYSDEEDYRKMCYDQAYESAAMNNLDAEANLSLNEANASHR